MLWIVLALLGPIQHGLANIIDNHLTNNIFKKISTLVFYAVMINIIFLPIVFLIARPVFISFKIMSVLLLISLTDILYLYPYFKALQSDDTSTVGSLWSLGRIFVPLLAFIFVGEILTITKYLGFFIIIVSASLLTWEGRLKFNRSILYMTISSFLISLQGVLYKYVFISVSWGTGFFWSTLMTVILISLSVLVKNIRLGVMSEWPAFYKNIKIFFLEELLTFGGSAAFTLAISLTSVTLVNAISAFQPFFVLVYAAIFKRYFPRIFKEKLDSMTITKKILLFMVMSIGVVLLFM